MHRYGCLRFFSLPARVFHIHLSSLVMNVSLSISRDFVFSVIFWVFASGQFERETRGLGTRLESSLCLTSWSHRMSAKCLHRFSVGVHSQYDGASIPYIHLVPRLQDKHPNCVDRKYISGFRVVHNDAGSFADFIFHFPAVGIKGRCFHARRFGAHILHPTFPLHVIMPAGQSPNHVITTCKSSNTYLRAVQLVVPCAVFRLCVPPNRMN